MTRRRRGTGSIERYIDRHGIERFRARLVLASGEKKPVGVYASEPEAEAALRQATDRLASAELVRIAGVTVRGWGKLFLERREAEGVRGLKTEKSRWSVLVDASLLADLPLRTVTRREAKQWLAWLSTRRIRYRHAHSKNGAKLSRVTQQNALNLVRKAFDVALEDELVAANPFAGLRLPRDPGRTHEPWTYLLPEEQTALLAAVPEPERYVVAFALGTGLRQGEQWALRWEDVDLEARQVVVRFGSDGKPTKSGRIRRVPLFGIAAHAIAARAVHVGKDRLRGLVWPAASGERRQRKAPVDWHRWVAAAGIKRRVRWHDLRHTCASTLIAGWWGRRWSLEETKAMLGHRSITTTERYAHLADTALKLAASATAGVILDKPDVSPPILPEGGAT